MKDKKCQKEIIHSPILGTEGINTIGKMKFFVYYIAIEQVFDKSQRSNT